MIKRLPYIFLLCCAVALVPALLFAFPTVYPTGTTLYQPEKCWNGYTILSTVVRPEVPTAVRLIDMNGNIVHTWDSIHAMPAKLLPNGDVLGRSTSFAPSYEVLQVDWDGDVVWSFPNNTQHHDIQREGNPVGYYAPGMESMVDGGKTLILGDDEDGLDNIVEVGWDGTVLWRWDGADHIDEIKTGVPLDINTASWLGPNRWYDAGDERFHPDNIICDNLIGDVIFIISRETGGIVWKVGPDFVDEPGLKRLGLNVASGRGLFVGGMLHHAHMIPRGLPGEVEGLVHLSELSWKRVNKPSEVLAVGDTVNVSVLKIDEDNQRIALSIKRLEPDPWTFVEDTYQPGQLAEATITRLTKFGAFARLNDDYELEGLIHVSEMADDRVEHPRDIVKTDDKVTVRIIRVDQEQRQLGLSLKQVASDKYIESDLAMFDSP